MSQHPYTDLGDHCFWGRSVTGVPRVQFDPVVRAPFRIAATDKVATFGASFAHRLGPHLRGRGMTHLVTETFHPGMRLPYPEEYGYGAFTTRCGPILNSRHLLQTLLRAHDRFSPTEDAWPAGGDRVIDPYRPTVQPEGFVNLTELRLDRAQHFRAIRRAIQTLDVLVITLTTTECWRSRQDGAVFALAPGLLGGDFDPDRHERIELRMADVLADLTGIVALVLRRNPKARIILTVSPEAQGATARDDSVLTVHTYDKSVLRAAVGEIEADHPAVAYFPAYELALGQHARGATLLDDRRRLTPHAMMLALSLFMRHYAGETEQPATMASEHETTDYLDAAEELAAVMCDEIALARERPDATQA